MKPNYLFWILPVFPAFLALISCTTPKDEPRVKLSVRASARNDMSQVPTWSPQDLDFFLHGSMSTEVVPETVLRAFILAYPDLFPSADLSHLGLIPDPKFGWPVGFSRKEVTHLGGLSSVGVNCAACHTAEITSAGGSPVRVLGVTAHFDAEAYFGSVIVATFRTSAPTNMQRFLAAWLAVNDPTSGDKAQQKFARDWRQQEGKIISTISADPFGSKDVVSGALHKITGNDLRLDHRTLDAGADLPALAHSILKLFHNMRAALHVPDQPPDKTPPASGPGRNDAFGLLSGALFGVSQPYAPVKYGLVWNVENRPFVHWDGNTRSALGRNLLASLGLGAPLTGTHGGLDFALVKRQTDLTEQIRAPRYPWAVDEDAAKRGAAHYQAYCASCHDGAETDARLHTAVEIGTDPTRAAAFNQAQADRFNRFLAELETPGYKPSDVPGIRGTQKYWAASMPGVWARSPYLHNGSVRTMHELLMPPAARAKTFHRGSRVYDAAQMGYSDEGAYVLDTSILGNSNAGHAYGIDLSGAEKRELIEYLKTL